MKIFMDLSIENFNAWSGATYTRDRIIRENKVDEFDQLIEDLYPQGLSETELNDLLWFDDEWIYESLGMEIEE